MKSVKILALSATLLSTFIWAQQDLKQNIEQIVKGKKAKVGVAIWHLEKGDILSLNGDSHLPMQSVFKFHIGLTILDLVDQGKLKLDQKIKFSKEELMLNTWSPMRDKYPNGAEIPLSEMLKVMVAQSDNNACDILLNKIGGVDIVQDYIDKIGIKDFQIVANEEMMHKITDFQYQNYTTANAANLLLKKLYTEPILKKSSKDVMIKILEETTTKPTRLRGELPQNTIVAHKTGTSFTEHGKTAATNDIGVITLPNGQHIIVSVLVSDSYENDETNDKIIADIAKASWDFYAK